MCPGVDVMPTPQQHALLADLAVRLEATAHGERSPLIQHAARRLGVSAATVHRWLEAHRDSGRKQRSDAGQLCLTREEAVMVASYLNEGPRGNGKQIVTLVQAVAILRANQRIAAERIDTATGEIFLLSESAIGRALRHYGLHPSQVRVPVPHQPLSSPHPNWCWQVDASVCVIYYLADGGAGLCELKQAVHYKNKPENLKAIEQFRVIRYVATDHCSGVLRVRYYPHSESGENTVRFLAWLMAPKVSLADPFHGAPKFVMVDPGATSAGLVRRFCTRLGVELIVNKPGNPRAKGQVEQGNNLWEIRFESGLRYVRGKVTDFASLNALADTYQLHLNATAIHSRTQTTRFAKWLEITAEQLRTTAPEAALLALATEAAETPKVSGELTVRFRGRTWSVRAVPGVTVKAKLDVHWYPFLADTAMAVVRDAEGRELHIPLDEVTTNAHGFPSTAATIGVEFKSPPQTVSVTHARELAQHAAGTQTLRDTDKVRKDKDFTPFDGAVNPYLEAETAPALTYLPRAGTPLDVAMPVTASRMLTATRAAMVLRERMGEEWRPEFFDFLQRRHADGISEEALERLAQQWDPETAETTEEARHAAAG